LLSGCRAKIIGNILAITITIIVVVQFLYFSNPYAYEVYLNGKHLAYIKDKEEFYNAKISIEKDLEKRIGKVVLNDNVRFNNLLWINPSRLSDSNAIKKSIINNTNTQVPVVLMKSDGKEVAFLANEDEMKKVLDGVKSTYKQKDNNGTFKLKNNITYIKQVANLDKLKSVEDAVKVTSTDSKYPLISFYKENQVNKIDSVSLSRSASVSKLMYTPSRGSITSAFGVRWGRMHNGVDIGSPMGDPIYAAMNGKIYYAGWEEGYGNVIKIDHGAGIQTIYGHCNKIDVIKGQIVNRGEKVGEVGSTGNSTGPHVHFEVRVDGIPQNPLKYLN
jgi:murein DD-endopeptidase MepM/ murein hydrolase activator NlpD